MRALRLTFPFRRVITGENTLLRRNCMNDLKRLFGYMGPYRRDMALGMLLVVVGKRL